MLGGRAAAARGALRTTVRTSAFPKSRTYHLLPRPTGNRSWPLVHLRQQNPHREPEEP